MAVSKVHIHSRYPTTSVMQDTLEKSAIIK